MNKASRDRQGGAVLPFVAIILLVLVAMVGVAIDSSRAFLIKARESAAVDGAAIAAGQAFTLGKTPAEQQAIAEHAAMAVFTANFEEGAASSTPGGPTPVVGFKQEKGCTTISVDAVRDMASSLSRVLTINPLTVQAGATVTTCGRDANIHRDPVDLQVILDESSSMADTNVLPNARLGISALVRQLNPTQDRFSFMQFAHTAREKIAFMECQAI